MAWWRDSYWRPYVSVSQRRAQGAKKIKELAKKGHQAQPIAIEGRKIAHTFWGKAWCENLERYSDFANRLPRGRTYVRNGSVIDLQIAERKVTALVSGSEIYTVKIDFAAAAKKRWQELKSACAGQIDSLVELLQGRFSQGVMEKLTAREGGLFPEPKEIELDCSCPDGAYMCKHVAAALYGVGARLDAQPELLFLLRQVDHLELISAAAGASLAGATPAGTETAMEKGEMEQLFGIEIQADTGAAPPASPAPASPAPARRSKGAKKVPPAAAKTRQAPAPPARTPQTARERARGGYTAKVSLVEVRRALLQQHFEAEDTLTPAQYRQLFSVPAAKASQELRRLTDSRLLIQRGKKRGTTYVVGVELF